MHACMYIPKIQKFIMGFLGVQGLNNVTGLISGAMALFHNMMIVIYSNKYFVAIVELFSKPYYFISTI